MKKALLKSIFSVFLIAFIFTYIASVKTDYLKYRINNSGILNELQKRNGTTGFAIGHIKDTFEAWYKNDWYPIKNEVRQKLLKNKRSKSSEKNTELIMRNGSTIFQGEFYRLHYAVPGYLINKEISPITTNIILALISLFFIILTCLKERKMIFLIVFILTLISSDYYIYENFVNENIFAVPISISIIFFCFVHIFNENFKRYFYFYSFFLGILISLFTNIRSEFVFLILTYLISVLFYYNLKKIISSSIILLTVFFISNNYLNDRFVNKINKTNEILEKHNGVPYKGPIGSGHTFWHPFWMGFGDNVIGQKLGFQWGDVYAYNYVAGINPDLFDKDEIEGHSLKSSYDLYGIYQKKPELIVEYQLTLKKDLIQKFNANKIKFLKIYCIKLKNFLTKLQGIDYSYLNNVFLKKYLNGFYIFLTSLTIFICFVIKEKSINSSKFYLKFICVTLPTGLSSLIVSDMGATYVSFFHFILFSSVFQMIYDLIKTNHPKFFRL